MAVTFNMSFMRGKNALMTNPTFVSLRTTKRGRDKALEPNGAVVGWYWDDERALMEFVFAFCAGVSSGV